MFPHRMGDPINNNLPFLWLPGEPQTQPHRRSTTVMPWLLQVGNSDGRSWRLSSAPQAGRRQAGWNHPEGLTRACGPRLRLAGAADGPRARGVWLLCALVLESRALSVPFDDPGWKLRGRTPLSSVAAMVTSCCGLGISYVRLEPRSREEMRTRKANGAGERSRPTMDPASGPSREGSLRQAPVGSWTVSVSGRLDNLGPLLGEDRKYFNCSFP